MYRNGAYHTGLFRGMPEKSRYTENRRALLDPTAQRRGKRFNQKPVSREYHHPCRTNKKQKKGFIHSGYVKKI